MIKKKYLILGAGPAGLTLANMLLDRGEEDFLLLEKEDVAGGLCRTEYVGSNPVDIGGGHILDVRSQRVCDYMFRFLPKDKWNIFDRDSKIRFQDQFMGSPFESHIWQLPVEDQVRYIKSVAIAGCNLGTPKPEKFVDWIRWKLGDEIAENYMLPYNRKMSQKTSAAPSCAFSSAGMSDSESCPTGFTHTAMPLSLCRKE